MENAHYPPGNTARSISGLYRPMRIMWARTEEKRMLSPCRMPSLVVERTRGRPGCSVAGGRHRRAQATGSVAPRQEDGG
jgi:hypothetical protein